MLLLFHAVLVVVVLLSCWFVAFVILCVGVFGGCVVVFTVFAVVGFVLVCR